MALGWDDRLGQPRRGRFALAAGFTAQARLGQHAADAATAHHEACLRPQRRDPARARRPAPLGKIARDFVPSPLGGCRVNAGGAGEPLVGATA